MGKVLFTCLMLASQTYNMPPEVLFSIYSIEGGKTGQIVGPNKNGSYDIGPMQINTIWLPELAEIWGVDKNTAYKWVRYDTCTNVGVSAWILRKHYDETGSMSKAISQYHSRTPHIGKAYKNKVVKNMIDNGWLKLGRRS